MGIQRLNGVKKVFLGFASVYVAGSLSNADTVTLEPVADTSLFELNPNYNFGAQSDVPSGTLGAMAGLAKSRLLVKFDIEGALPNGAVIDAATLRLSVVVSPSGRANSVFEVKRIAFDWGEGNQKGSEPGGAEATSGEATWDNRFHPSTGWDDPGGDIGTDFVHATSAEATVFHLGTYVFEFNSTGVADLVSMYNDPMKNFGWAIISKSEGTAKTARRWATRENSNTSIRPQLEIEYSVAPQPPEPEIRSVDIGDRSIGIRILALGGIQYSLERGEALDEDTWTNVGDIAAESESREVEFVIPKGVERSQFFRVVATFEAVRK